MKLLLSTSAQTALAALASNPGGAYLFHGARGVGKSASARELAAELAHHPSDIVELSLEGNSIGIDTVHQLINQLRLQRVEQAGQRVVIIDDAQTLTREAQNALLKLLEEPPLGTSIILISSERNRLLSTIISRLKVINFESLASTKIAEHLQAEFGLEGTDATAMAIAANGSVGIASQFAQDDELWQSHQALQRTAQALLRASLFEKLLMLQDIQKSGQTEQLITSLQLMLHKQLREVANLKDGAKLRGLVRQLKLIQWFQDYLVAHGNAKHGLDRLAMELSV